MNCPACKRPIDYLGAHTLSRDGLTFVLCPLCEAILGVFPAESRKPDSTTKPDRRKRKSDG